jgi:hypothetical protein
VSDYFVNREDTFLASFHGALDMMTAATQVNVWLPVLPVLLG